MHNGGYAYRAYALLAYLLYLIITTTPPTVHDHLSLSMTAHELFKTLQALFEKKATATTTVLDARENDTMQVAARTSNRVRNGSGRQRDNRDSPSNGTRREHERRTTDQGRVRRKQRVGKEGEKSRGRVEEEAAAAPRGPGRVTTARTTDGMSLATPASSPTASQAVDNTTADPANHNATSAGPTEPVDESPEPPVASEPPRQQSEPTSHDRMPPSEDASGGEVQEVAMSHEVATGDEVEGGETDDEECRTLERIDDKYSRVETSEDETTETTSASAPSASCDHPDEDAVTTDPARQSRDPADAPDGDERRPDEPTEPPDKTEGMGGQDCDTRVSEVSRGVEDGPGENIDEEHRPQRPDGAPDEAQVPADVEFEPGGETDVKRNGSAAHEDADAAGDGSAEETHRDVQAEVGSVETCRETSMEGERWCASAHIRSATRAEENGQRISTSDDDVPGTPHHHHTPAPMSDEPARPENEPPSVELEGERNAVTSCEVGRTGGETDVPGTSECIEADGNQPTKLKNTSEREHGRSKQRSRKYSPGRPGEEPEAPGGETAVQDDAQTYQDGPIGEGNQRVDDANALCRDTWPGGQMGELEGSRGVEVVRDRVKVVDGAGYDLIHPRTDGNERVVETNSQCRRTGPGGHGGEQVGWGDIEGDRERQRDGDGDQRGGRRGGQDGATSGARRDPKRVETTPLAAGETGQHGRRNRRTTDVPEASKPPSIHPRRPTNQPNPPRRRGRLKTRPRRISTRKWTYQVTRRVEGESGESDRSETLYMDYRWCWSNPEARYAQTSPLESIETDCAHLDRAATCHIWTPLERREDYKLRKMLHGIDYHTFNGIFY